MPEEEQNPEEQLHGLSFRALLIALLMATAFSWVMAMWVRQGELITFASQVSESVPPIPAVAALVLLLLANPLLRAISRRLALSRGQILVIYTFCMISVVMSSCGVMRSFFPFTTALQYFSESRNGYEELLPFLNPMFFPKDQEAIRAFYEGADDGKIMWAAWATPVLLWLAFFMVLYLTMLCVFTIFRRQWVERERLTFPLVEFAVQMTEEGKERSVLGTFFANPLMWVGFGIVVLFHFTNMLHSFNPSVPSAGRTFELPLQERPWSALSTTIHYRPVLLGLGYLIPLDITFSSWVCYFLMRFENMMALASGYEIAEFPFEQQQAVGSYLALLLSILWISRSHLKDVAKKAILGTKAVDDRQEPIPYRLAFFGCLFGFAFLIIFCIKMGMGWLPAILLMGIWLSFALVYGKLRAEGGAPVFWLYPYNATKEVLIYTVGSGVYSVGSLTMLSYFRFLTRGYFLSTPAFQIEGMKIADAGGVSRRQMSATILIATLMGLLSAYWIHLQAHYQYGGNVLEATDTAQGGFRIYLATQEYNQLVRMTDNPTKIDVPQTVWTGMGFLTTGIFIILRKMFFGFPLHPMGFALATTYGSVLWGPFFFAWFMKFLVLKLGGLRLYQRVTAMFLGIVFGEFFAAGAWSLIGLVNPDWALRYLFWYG